MSIGSILLIEDERINALALKKGLSRVNAENELVIFEMAEDALEYLHHATELPSIIILDLNLPRMDGIGFLKIIKKDDLLKRIPVIVLTTSTNPKDKTDCFNLQVAGYFVKPIDYFELVISVINYWTKSEFAFAQQAAE